jgi:hypothetical protein
VTGGPEGAEKRGPTRAGARYPDEKPEPKPRKPLSEIVHLESYGNRLKA